MRSMGGIPRIDEELDTSLSIVATDDMVELKLRPIALEASWVN